MFIKRVPLGTHKFYSRTHILWVSKSEPYVTFVLQRVRILRNKQIGIVNIISFMLYPPDVPVTMPKMHQNNLAGKWKPIFPTNTKNANPTNKNTDSLKNGRS